MTIVKCKDCGVPYKEMGLDMVLPSEQWKRICPEDNCILCASCICKRAEKLPNKSVIVCWIM